MTTEAQEITDLLDGEQILRTLPLTTHDYLLAQLADEHNALAHLLTIDPTNTHRGMKQANRLLKPRHWRRRQHRTKVLALVSFLRINLLQNVKNQTTTTKE